MTEPTPPAVEPQQPAQPAQSETDWKAEARKWEARAKENSGAATRLAELENAKKTEAEKTAERLTAAERKAADAELSALRLDVALDKAPDGMAVAQVRKLARRLSGSTREEMEADAAELFADFAPKPKPTADSRRPVEALKSGALPAGETTPVDPNDWMRRRPSRT